MASKKTSKTVNRIEITFIGGEFDGRTSEFVYPTPEFLVMNLGRDLYKKETSIQYRFQEDWTEYKKIIQKESIL